MDFISTDSSIHEPTRNGPVKKMDDWWSPQEAHRHPLKKRKAHQVLPKQNWQANLSLRAISHSGKKNKKKEHIALDLASTRPTYAECASHMMVIGKASPVRSACSRNQSSSTHALCKIWHSQSRIKCKNHRRPPFFYLVLVVPYQLATQEICTKTWSEDKLYFRKKKKGLKSRLTLDLTLASS